MRSVVVVGVIGVVVVVGVIGVVVVVKGGE